MSDAVKAALAELAVLVRERRQSEFQPWIDELRRSPPPGDARLLEACANLGAWFVQAHAGRFSQGLAEAIGAVEQLAHAGHADGVAWARSPIGFGMGIVGNVETGLAWVEDVIGQARRSGDLAMLKAALSNKGALFSMAGDQSRAIEVYLEFLHLEPDRGPGFETREVILRNNLAFAFIRWARSLDEDDPARAELAQNALSHADQAKALLRGLPDPRWRAWSLTNRASALALLGRRDEAMAGYREALPLSADNLRVHLLLLAGLGEVLAEVAQFDEARALFDEAYAKAPTDLLDSTIDFVMEGRVRLEVLSGRGADALRWSTLRYRRLQEQNQARLHNALKQAELLASLERDREQERASAEAAIRESREREREALLRDLHDGFGSQLASARLRIEREDVDREELATLLRDCLDDLYLVMDALGNSDENLRDAVADYRHRCEGRFSGLPVRIAWNVDLDDCPPMGERRIMQVLRILQEALGNAIRHAEASSIVVDASFGGDRIVVSVRDDGKGLAEGARPGRGLNNMRSRAREMGATLEIAARDPGTCVRLELSAVP